MNSIKRKINKFIRKNMLPIKNHWEVFFYLSKTQIAQNQELLSNLKKNGKKDKLI